MLSFLSRNFVFLLLCLPIAFLAQDLTSLPKITPSYSEDFQAYKSYPSMCFQDAFRDKNGRLWLATCGSASMTSSLHLFQFDGYRFRLIQGALEQLGVESNIYGMYQEQALVGITHKIDHNQLFFYDLETNQLTFHALEAQGTVKDLAVSDDRFFLTMVHDEQLSLYEWKDGQLESQGQFNEPDLSKVNIDDFNIEPFYHDENIFWGSLRYAKYIIRIDKKTGTLKKYNFADFESQNQESKITSPVYSALPSVESVLQGNDFYISTQFLDGSNMFKWDPASDNFTLTTGIPTNWRGEHIFQDEKGNLLFLFKSSTHTYSAILQDKKGKRFDYSDFLKDLQGTSITQLISSDFKQELIICSAKGISVHIVKATEAIQHFLPSTQIRAMIELPDEQILVSTQSHDQFIIDREKTSAIPLQLSSPDCGLGWTKFHSDDSGNIWTSYFNNIVKYDPTSNTCITYPCQSENIRLFTFIDKHKIAIIDKDEKLYIHDLISQKTEPFLENGQVKTFSGYAHELLYGQNNLLWVATAHGLWKIDLSTGKSEVIGMESPFQDARFLSMHEDEKGRLWLGTPLHGLYIYDPVTGEVKNLSSEDGLPNNTIASIVSDEAGIRWIGTYNGISLVSSEGELISNLYTEDGLVERENNRYATLKTRDGKLFIGTINGLNYIDPKKVKEKLTRNKDLKIYLTSLSRFDEKTGTDKIQEYGLADPGTVHLSASKRFLNLKFALSNYFKPDQNQYAYMLEGKDKDWIPLGNQHNLNLINLPAGKYRLLIKGSDGLGNWTQEPLAINIQANEFFYKKVWFYLICSAILGGLGLLWITRLRSEVKKATKTIREDKETIERQAEELKELDKAKSKFFTNISHEFRTPLTIISGTIDQVKVKPEVWLEKGADMIKQNTNNLLDLINQILDLRKLESNVLPVNLVKGDIVKYLKYLMGSYQSYAENKGLQLHFISSQSSIIMDYDPDVFLRILSNLLSNAIKYNKEKGNVYFNIDHLQEEEKEYLRLKVQDTGAGIPAEKLPQIFDRFYQVNEPGEKKVIGSGIGLALTQELVHLMNGEIEAKSELGVGSTFFIKIPITRNASIGDTLSTKTTTGLSQVDLIPTPLESQTDLNIVTNGESSDLPSLLIVEDNPDIIQILIACLEDDYQLNVANNGQEGIDKAIESVPDVIVSDVMMPIKNGFELCNTLKQDERTSHIPIILLTAKTDIDSKISGLEKGADAYLAKPFEQKELLVRLKKLLELRQKLQERYRGLGPNETEEPSSLDDVFIQKVRQIIEDNMSDETFKIVNLCRAIGLSRAQLHNKVKALTGLSTSIYIRSIRLNRAKHLLETTELNVSEIAYEVGFKNPTYFSSSFVEEFGIRPSKARK